MQPKKITREKVQIPQHKLKEINFYNNAFYIKDLFVGSKDNAINLDSKNHPNALVNTGLKANIENDDSNNSNTFIIKIKHKFINSFKY